eukprot:TRINITY_DN15113_c0_g1_i1.p1 TRINITY_DN15113_c0_g1~~TRINITY_DN15113_c0_g1_i1.p1  ORF type:complete len:157 (+),score=22.09 TRINITY_DN15113_c0_g1_i1:53-523(+)
MYTTLLIAASCLASEGRTDFSLTFTDKGSILQSVPIGQGRWAEVEEMTLQTKGNNIFGEMTASCVGMTPGSPDDSQTAGWCEFKNPSGDTIHEYYKGTITAEGGSGTGSFQDGTGIYSNIKSNHTWTYVFTSSSDDTYEGKGEKHGQYYSQENIEL